MPSLSWLGEDLPHLDAPHIAICGPVALGCYGGTTRAGATKNEDGAWILCGDDSSWELAALLDAHATSQSAALIIRWFEQSQTQLESICQELPHIAIPELSALLTQTFASHSFRQAAHATQGETACLIAFRTAQWLFWLSVGDCVVYLLHPDLMRMGQYALNQRQFYEWIGHVNTFDHPVPCFTSGVRELRDGRQTIVMLTDGVLECGSRPFEDPARLANELLPDIEANLARGVQAILDRVVAEEGRDSATMIAWQCNNILHHAAQPSG
jgi:serine/threonine protein phosphatase PrpC